MVLNGTLASDPSDFCPSSNKFRCEREVTTAVCVRDRLCPSGHYRPATAAAQRCEACPSGRYSTATESRTCTPCAAGRYTAQPGARVCVPCAGGTFARDVGASSCAGCPVGSLCAGLGSVHPQPCTGLGGDQGWVTSEQPVYVTGARSNGATRYCPSGAAYARLSPPGWFALAGAVAQPPR